MPSHETRPPMFCEWYVDFNKGNFRSVMLMLRVLLTFSNTSGLSTNASKSNIYTTNKEKKKENDICELTRYVKRLMPSKYLGIPISSKKIFVIDCKMLVENISYRTKARGTRHLSYARWVQLVNSVLLHIHSYWA